MKGNILSVFSKKKQTIIAEGNNVQKISAFLMFIDTPVKRAVQKKKEKVALLFYLKIIINMRKNKIKGPNNIL